MTAADPRPNVPRQLATIVAGAPAGCAVGAAIALLLPAPSSLLLAGASGAALGYAIHHLRWWRYRRRLRAWRVAQVNAYGWAKLV